MQTSMPIRLKKLSKKKNHKKTKCRICSGNCKDPIQGNIRAWLGVKRYGKGFD